MVAVDHRVGQPQAHEALRVVDDRARTVLLLSPRQGYPVEQELGAAEDVVRVAKALARLKSEIRPKELGAL